MNVLDYAVGFISPCIGKSIQNFGVFNQLSKCLQNPLVDADLYYPLGLYKEFTYYYVKIDDGKFTYGLVTSPYKRDTEVGIDLGDQSHMILNHFVKNVVYANNRNLQEISKYFNVMKSRYKVDFDKPDTQAKFMGNYVDSLLKGYYDTEIYKINQLRSIIKFLIDYWINLMKIQSVGIAGNMSDVDTINNSFLNYGK